MGSGSGRKDIFKRHLIQTKKILEKYQQQSGGSWSANGNKHIKVRNSLVYGGILRQQGHGSYDYGSLAVGVCPTALITYLRYKGRVEML